MKLNAKILICYNSPVSIFPVYNGKPSQKGLSFDDLSENGFLKEINGIKNKLSKYFRIVNTLAVDKNVERTISQINNFSPNVIFNFVESVEGIASYEYCMAGVFQLLGFEFTGNLPACLGNCLNKARTKNILKSFGIPTPDYITVKPKEKITEIDIKLAFPLILKLLNEDASIGISEFSVVKNFEQLKKQLNFLQRTYKQEIIIEEYIEGRELNVAILKDKALPISEIKFTGLPKELPKIVTYDSKWIANSIYYENTKPQCPAKLNQKTKIKLENTALLAFEALNCRDYARVDIRLKKNIPYVVEVNPNPDISFDSGFARAANVAGIPHQELLFKIANFALSRYKELNLKRNDPEIKAS
jgi:D-alanine-D-alanine ligase